MTERMSAAQLLAEQSKPKRQQNAAGRNAKRHFAHGIWFDSKKEARRWGELLLMQRAGQITGLRRQCPIILQGRDGPILTATGREMIYRADFVYIEAGEEVVEDAKGHPSDIYLIKKAILAAQGVKVREV